MNNHPYGGRDWVFSVSLSKGLYRHIQIPAGQTLYQLAEAITDAFGFDFDHAHAFFMDNRFFSTARVYMSERDEENAAQTDDVALTDVLRQPGDAFKFLYDFGEEWRFSCKWLRAADGPAGRQAVVIQSVGAAPAQYGRAEDDEFEGESYM